MPIIPNNFWGLFFYKMGLTGDTLSVIIMAYEGYGFDMKVKIPVECRSCGKVHTINADDIDVLAYADGVKVQDAFPYLESLERELIISGLCNDCWKEIFGEIEE